MIRIVHIILICILFALPNAAHTEELCIDGTLLFREDFGGNDVYDPVIGGTPVSGIDSKYKQDTLCGGRLGMWHYIIAKQGCYDSELSWHIMDDHTYPDDITRGYFFETNGKSGLHNTILYQKELAGVCEGMELSFSTYIANIETAKRFKQVPFYSYSYPRLSFVVTDARTGTQLARYSTDTISHDWSLFNTPDSWKYSAQWHLEGLKFTIPNGTDKVMLSIIDSPTSGQSEGNDFAIDDIEIHLCTKAEYQLYDTTVCDTLLPYTWQGLKWDKAGTKGFLIKDISQEDSVYIVYSLNTSNCPFPPITITQDTTICDSISHIEWHEKIFDVADIISDTSFSSYGFDSIYYVLYVATEHCCPSVYKLHHFSVSDDQKVLFAPVNLQYYATEGTHLCADETIQKGTWRFAEHQWDYVGEDNVNASASYSGWIDLFCWGTSGWNSGAIAYQPWATNIYSSDYMEATPHDMTGEYRFKDWAVYNAIGNDVPEKWRTLTKDELYFLLYYRTNADNLYGMAAINGIYGLILLPDDYSFSAMLPEFKAEKDLNNGKNIYTIEEWQQLEKAGAVFLPCAGVRHSYPLLYENNGVGTYWSSTQEFLQNGGAIGILFSVYSVQINGGGHLNQALPVRPVWDVPKNYIPTEIIDTIVCDTLLPIIWHGHVWQNAGVVYDTLQSICGTDSLCLQLSLKTQICCQSSVLLTYDTTVCDTLLPYTWRGMVFEKAGEKRWIEKNTRDCDSIEHVYTLDTIHCERLYPIIVNKYNWMLLLDNVTLRELFPNQVATGYQWYKNEAPILGATDDDYSEQNKLEGVFQLRVTLSEEQTIWSNILTINEDDVAPEVRKRIYDTYGNCVPEERMMHGIYLIRYEQGPKSWTEKKLIP